MLFLIHGWASGSAVWPQWLRENAYCYQSVQFPDGKELEETFCKNFFEQEEKITIAGWSLGGMLALELAAAHPDKVEKLILFSSTPRFLQDAVYYGGLPSSVVKNMNRKLLRNQWDTQQAFYRMMFAENEKSWELEFIETLAPCFSGLSLGELQGGLDYLMERDLRDLLPGIRVPCLIIHGSEDQICLPEAAVYLENHLPQAYLTMLSGAGHIPFLTQQSKVREIVREWEREIGT